MGYVSNTTNSMSWVNTGNVWKSEGSWAGALFSNNNSWSATTQYCSKLNLYYAKIRADAVWPFTGSKGRMSCDAEFNWGDYSKQKWHWDGVNVTDAKNYSMSWSPTPTCPSSALQNRTLNGIQISTNNGHRVMNIWITFWLYFMRDDQIVNSTCKVVSGWVPCPTGDGSTGAGPGGSINACQGWFSGGDTAGSGKVAHFRLATSGYFVSKKPVTFTLYKSGSVVGSRTLYTGNGDISASITFYGSANTTYYIECSYNGRRDTITYKEPPPYPPVGLWANNTGSDNVTTEVYKYSSCSFGISETGYLPCKFQVKCYTRDRVSGAVKLRGDTTGWNIGKYDNEYSSSHSCNFNLDLNENVDVYYVVDVWNDKGRRSVTTGTRRLHRIYTEPSNPSNASVTPTSQMQLYDGNTVTYNFTAKLNAWGDRPTACMVYVRQFKNSTQVKDVYSRSDSRSGEVSYTFSTKTDKSYIGNVLRFNLVKFRDPTWTTNIFTNYVNFYETKGVSSASASLNRTIFTVNKAGKLTYNYKYTRNSSAKFRMYYQVVRMSSAEILQQADLVNRSTSGEETKTVDLTPFKIRQFEGETYVIRIYSEITELFDDKTTSLLYTIPIQYYEAPVAQIHQTPSKPLNKDIINFDSDITYTTDIWYTGKINKVELRYRLAEVETGYKERTVDITSGKFEYKVPMELQGGTDCTAYLYIEYDLGGMPETITSDTVKLTVTPTRYVFYRTQDVSSEYRHNKMHFTNNNASEKTAYKIYVDS